MLTTQELQKRVDAFQNILQKRNIEGALLVQRADTMYFAGTAQELNMYIPNEGAPLVTAKRNLQRVQQETPWRVIPLTGISGLPRIICHVGHAVPKTLGLEYDVLPVVWHQRFKRAFAKTEFSDISYDLRRLRAIKSHWEISQIEYGSNIYARVLDYIITVLKPSMTEVELESIAEAEARKMGHDPMIRLRSFNSELHYGTFTAGVRAAIPSNFDGPIGGLGTSSANPFGPSRCPIKPDEAILVDIGHVYNGYHSDQTRMVVMGELPRKLGAAYKISLEVEERIRRAMIPGRVCGEIYDEILAWVQEETPFAPNFMGVGSTQCRFIAHGVGLELDELPIICRGSKEVLQPGMTIAVEPKFVFPGEGAVGIEDTFVVEGDDGARELGQISKEVLRVNVC